MGRSTAWSGKSVAKVQPPGGSPSALSRAGLRLLRALAEDGATASPDPIRAGKVAVAGARSGISLGRGHHAADALAELRRGGLVDEAAGRSALRRAEVPADAAPYAAQHQERRVETVPDGSGDRVLVNVHENPLSWLRRRRDRDGEFLIDAAAYEAGERLRRDLTFAGMLPRVTARWDGAVGGSSAAMRDPAGATDAVIAARQRVSSTLAAVGSDFAGLLIDLCGFLKGLEAIERERSWPPRSGKVVVRLALRQLARHYGLESEAEGPAASSGIRTWTGETWSGGLSASP